MFKNRLESEVIFTNKYPDQQDRVLIKDYMELHTLLDLLQDNLKALDNTFRLPHTFKAHLTSMMDSVTKELKYMRKAGRMERTMLSIKLEAITRNLAS